MSNQATLRIIRELNGIQQSDDLSIAVACQEDDVRSLNGLIVGPPDTPYEFGFFEFAIAFPDSYPTQPPSITCLTTNNGCTRFNPNIYTNGKVCLSILGTWRGHPGEQWSSAQGLESVLLSVQSLMSANPYENEPGFENLSERYKEDAEHYLEKIRHETLRIAVIKRLEKALGIYPNATLKRKRPATNRSMSDDGEEEDTTTQKQGEVKSRSKTKAMEEEQEMTTAPSSTSATMTPPPSTTSSTFNDLLKRRFLWYYDTYHAAIIRGIERYPKETAFKCMPFETYSNSMTGSFVYKSLLPRLEAIKQAILDETAQWGLSADNTLIKSGRVYNTLQRQCEQVIERLRERSDFTLDISLEKSAAGGGEGNPFVWDITYFGKPMTHLDGGVFNIKCHISPEFPVEKPRAFVKSPKLFHLRVAPSSGLLCYECSPKKEEDMFELIQGMIRALEGGESEPYDPRLKINAEAWDVVWGSDKEKEIGGKESEKGVKKEKELAERDGRVIRWKRYHRLLRRSVQDGLEEYN
ncbi:ubiquitin conjugating enzyme [Ascosphaera apis ARSEF 7405]|uniref:Ubiquitin-conjugating enzyme E2 Z n=1 Tax=Ascosphaera apis ARSEF 7405 TaxID=392613 RepID=A0A162IID9_9EURO|nr:ubiquitin conjugating enzyme [Ascosphaera apis ARSEF 7405]